MPASAPVVAPSTMLRMVPLPRRKRQGRNPSLAAIGYFRLLRAGEDPMSNWDVIIVGAGAAGCVLANRLSADPARRVLLLEAGAQEPPLGSRMPAAWISLIN